MEQLVQICRERKNLVIKDCAHIMGARWNAVRLGKLGHAARFSTQT
ncbi:MAG: DegT/DnrJ/EryC1/StrS family aminotransferase [Hyphomicrobiales bacterium]